MAGVRQHVLPRFLLKGFASRISNKQIYCWVFRKQADPFETNIINVAVEKSFYSEVDNTDVDDSITESEVQYSSLVEKLQNCTTNTIFTDSCTPEFIAHLEIRTSHLRNLLLESGSTFANEASKYFGDPQYLKGMILDKILNDPKFMLDIFEEEFRKKGLVITHAMKSQMLSLVQSNAQELVHSIDKEIEFLANQAAEKLPKIPQEVMKSAHLKALRDTISPEAKVDEYKKLIFELIMIPNGGLVLGDSGILFETDSSKRFATFFEPQNTLLNVFLPIANDKILVGKKDDSIRIPPSDVLNRAIAERSREFFISSQNNETNTNLRKLIGTHAQLMTDNEIKQTVLDLVLRNK